MHTGRVHTSDSLVRRVYQVTSNSMKFWTTWAWPLQRLKSYRNQSRPAWNYSTQTTDCTFARTESKSLASSKSESATYSFAATTEASKRSSHFASLISTYTSPCKEAVTAERSSIICYNTSKPALRNWHTTGQVKSCCRSWRNISDWKSTFLRTTTSLFTTRTSRETIKHLIKIITKMHLFIQIATKMHLLTRDLNKLIIVNTKILLINKRQNHRGHQATATSVNKRTWETQALRIKLARTWIISLAKVTSKTCCLPGPTWTLVIRASPPTHLKENWDQENFQTQAFKF